MAMAELLSKNELIRNEKLVEFPRINTSDTLLVLFKLVFKMFRVV
jgi:hypothetical protein